MRISCLVFMNLETQYALLLQPSADAAPEGTSSSSGGPGGIFGGSSFITIMLLMVGMLFLMTRSDIKKQKESEKLLKSLERGMKVRTTSGILGEIISLTDRDVVLAIADKVRINVLRTHIAGVDVPPAEAEKKDEKKAS